ncbi:SRPBCC family protein [Aquamicrobium sp. LC103]|uniref:SRPBCC family protein n=1 Tax=Aquamicrobium sp. LC103 TaxID=1120658 RepID=UPI00063EB688|nr:SRPBCC family protein [Aquamicrobium sp. LC103]TKT75417.1 ATPase [Aquamicrobium sp. LC103]
MAQSPAKRTDTASRDIAAQPQTIYRALIDPDAVARWRPPEGMKAVVHSFEPRVGGTFRMSFIYADPGEGTRGKSSDDADMFEGRFLELVPGERVVELIEFQSDDPVFAGPMKITTSLAAMEGGTRVTIVCEDVPTGIGESDHQAGMASTLKNLAAFTE